MVLDLSVAQVLGLVVILAITYIVYRKTRTIDNKSYLVADAPRDTVIVHQFSPGLHCPSISPFVMKLETFLRAAGVPYVNRYSRKFGPKGKIPWIQYNDSVVADSQLVMEFLAETCGANLSKQLSQREAAIGHVVRRTAEEFLYWSTVLYRLKFDTSGQLYRDLHIPAPFIWYMRTATASRSHAHGIGRHSKAEVAKMTLDDLRSFSVILGKNRFLFGNTKNDVTEVDCALFGQLTSLLWETPSCHVADKAKQEFPNLEQFCHNMKDEFWPDWSDRLSGGKSARTPTNSMCSGATANIASESDDAKTNDVTPVAHDSPSPPEVPVSE